MNYSRKSSTLTLLIVAVCCGLPLAWCLSVLATNPAVIADGLLSAFRWKLLARTLTYNAAAGVVAGLLALPVGLYLGRSESRLARALWLLLPACLFMPSLAFAYGWSQTLRLAGLTPLAGSWPDILRCILTLAAWLFPIPACLMGLALRRSETHVAEQALLDGALLRVTVRQLLTPLACGIAIVTVIASQEFSVYEPTGISVVATEVRMVFESGAFSSLAGTGPQSSADQRARAAAALATALPLLCITALVVWAILKTAATFAVDESPAGHRETPRAIRPSPACALAALTIPALCLLTPVISLYLSLKRTPSLSRVLAEFGPALSGSFTLAALTAITALTTALFYTPRIAGVLTVSLASFLVGGQLLAIALLRTFSPATDWHSWQSLSLYISDHWPIAVIAYAARFLWIALFAAHATHSRAWKPLREMAALDGATPFATTRHVILPLAWPALLAAAILTGALTLTEVPATVLLSPQNPQVLTPMLMTWVHMVRYDPMIEASLLMMTVSLLPALAALTLWSATRRGITTPTK